MQKQELWAQEIQYIALIDSYANFMLQKSRKEAFYTKKQSSAPLNCSISRYCYFAWKLEIPSLMSLLALPQP